MNLTINSSLVIPAKELKWHFSRSSGPGGQNVNTCDSRVELIFDIRSSSTLTHFQKTLLLNRLENLLINCCLRVISSQSRSQYKNRQYASAQMANLLKENLKPPPKIRKPTKPTFSSQKRSIEIKKYRSALKKKRQNKLSTDD